MPAAKSPRCECGHPKGKHAKGARGGCTVRVPRGGKGGRTQFRECSCLTYRSAADVSRETSPEQAAELMELDRARLRRQVMDGGVYLQLGGRDPGIYIDGRRFR